MTTQTKHKVHMIDIGEKLGWAAGITLLCLFVVFILYSAASLVYDIHGPFAFNANTIAYQNTDYSIRTKVAILDVVREKDKEPMYTIEFTDVGRKYEIPESTYMEYIGEDANAITINASKISMAVKAGRFGTTWDEAKTYAVYRYKTPWESGTISFTQQEVQQFYDMLCENKQGVSSDDLSFKYNRYTTGWAFDIDEKESYIEWSNRT